MAFEIKSSICTIRLIGKESDVRYYPLKIVLNGRPYYMDSERLECGDDNVNVYGSLDEYLEDVRNDDKRKTKIIVEEEL